MWQVSKLTQAVRQVLTGRPLARRQRRAPRRLVLLEAMEQRLLLSATLPGAESLSGAAPSAAIVVTDKLDYAPGETALISTYNGDSDGVGFQAGELVRFQVVRTDGIEDHPLGNVPWFVADGVGGFEPYQQYDLDGNPVDRDADGIADWIKPDTDGALDARTGTSWFVEDQYLGSTLKVTATGMESGAEAAAEFTDAGGATASLTVGAQSGTATYAGAIDEVTYAIDATRQSNGTFVGTYTVSGLPTGVTASPPPPTFTANGTASLTDWTLHLFVGNSVDEGTYGFTVTLTNSSGGGSVVNASGSLYVSPRALNVQASVTDQTYDGDANAVNGNGSISFTDDRKSGDVFTINYTSATFADKNVGDEKLVSVSGISLTGTDAHNYIVNASDNDNADINARGLDIYATSDSKTYDGTTDSAADPTSSGVQTGDSVTGLDQVFDSKDAGSRTLSISAYTVNDGNAGNNYTVVTHTAGGSISKADAVVTIGGYTGVYDAAAHGATGSVVGVDVGGAAAGTTLNLGDLFTNVPGGTAHWTFDGGTNYLNEEGDVAIVIDQADANVMVSGYTGVYDAAAHSATGTATGVGGVDLSAGLNRGASFTNVPGGTAHWTFSGGTNYLDEAGDASIVISKANATVVVTPYNVEYDGAPHTATLVSITGVAGETGATVGTVNLSGTTHTAAGTYTDTWTFTGTGNYNNTSDKITDVITVETGAVTRYIGQTVFTTSGSSSTTAQVTLTASIVDPDGTGLIGATVDFIDVATGKTLAAGVKVSQVAGQPSSGTANTVVTLSTGQYGSQSYLIMVKLSGGNYDNGSQSMADKTATVVVSQPSVANTIRGGGTIANLSTDAGLYGSTSNVGATTYSVGLNYNKSLTNLQGQITLSMAQTDGSIIYIKSNSLTSMTVTNVSGGKQSTVYTKASIYSVKNGITTTIDGNVTLRMDVLDMTDNTKDAIGFTVLSSKTGQLYYANDWAYVLDTTTSTYTWKNRWQSLASGSISIG